MDPQKKNRKKKGRLVRPKQDGYSSDEYIEKLRISRTPPRKEAKNILVPLLEPREGPGFDIVSRFLSAKDRASFSTTNKLASDIARDAEEYVTRNVSDMVHECRQCENPDGSDIYVPRHPNTPCPVNTEEKCCENVITEKNAEGVESSRNVGNRSCCRLETKNKDFLSFFLEYHGHKNLYLLDRLLDMPASKFSNKNRAMQRLLANQSHKNIHVFQRLMQVDDIEFVDRYRPHALYELLVGNSFRNHDVFDDLMERIMVDRNIISGRSEALNSLLQINGHKSTHVFRKLIELKPHTLISHRSVALSRLLENHGHKNSEVLMLLLKLPRRQIHDRPNCLFRFIISCGHKLDDTIFKFLMTSGQNIWNLPHAVNSLIENHGPYLNKFKLREIMSFVIPQDNVDSYFVKMSLKKLVENQGHNLSDEVFEYLMENNDWNEQKKEALYNLVVEHGHELSKERFDILLRMSPIVFDRKDEAFEKLARKHPELRNEIRKAIKKKKKNE